MSLVTARAAVADDTAKNVSSGLAVGAGLGYHAPLFGGELQYHQVIARRWWLVPYAGLGIAPTGGPLLAGVAGGVMCAWGQRHRIVVDTGVGVEAAEVYRSLLTGNPVEAHSMYGVVMAAGYQYVADGGFWIGAMVGASYLFSDPATATSRWLPALNVTAGYKIW